MESRERMKKAVEPPAEEAIMVWCGRRACIIFCTDGEGEGSVWEINGKRQMLNKWFEMAWKLRNAKARNAEMARSVVTWLPSGCHLFCFQISDLRKCKDIKPQ